MLKNPCIIELSEITDYDVSKIGNKANNLATLKNKLGLNNIPESLLLLHNGFEDVEKTLTLNSSYIDSFLKFPIIVRSSTTVEDSSNSFAGLFYSGICATLDELHPNILKVFDSISTESVKSYCVRMKVKFSDIKCAVLLQSYKKPNIAGVLFTRHPLTKDSSVIYIEYNEHSSDATTSGAAVPKFLIINKSDVEMISATWKNLCKIGLAIESYWNYSVDIEWVISEGVLWILQARSITA
ncbi:hypothetical protein FACS1894190_15960 [Spirochaetia bacterium]|nr:hypothetical protein FACS1894190_15960 [Spirochaetia bacterium]